MIRFRRKSFLFLVILPIILIIFSLPFIPARYLLIKTIQVPAAIVHHLLNQIRSITNLRVIVFDAKQYEGMKKDYARVTLESRELSVENERLRKLLEFKQKTKYEYIPAEVIFCDASNWSWGAIINKGKSSGIKKDNAVVTYEGLVGKVDDVWSDIAHIILLNDPNFAAQAMVGDSHQMGLVTGSLDGSCKMIYVSEAEDIKIGDEVVTSGMGSIFKKGIPIGKVVSMDKDYAAEAYFLVKPVVKMNRLEEVLVIKE